MQPLIISLFVFVSGPKRVQIKGGSNGVIAGRAGHSFLPWSDLILGIFTELR